MFINTTLGRGQVRRPEAKPSQAKQRLRVNKRKMEQVANLLQRAANSNAVINTLLASVFAVLSLRSVEQQRQIEALEAEKDSLVKANKGLKKTIWDWKQQLFSEAEANPQNAFVPLSTLKVIYGEATPAASVIAGGADKGDAKSTASKIMI
ncbi:uncharacterized protein LOC111394347 [Olea europaea var. sylvestris]|uniref:uncharacterized protein LOC111394347 n=1 Tax=Olea europaea var. sylvestris TaxID=158386 RepID=UPI000C1CE83E|nr:uncharacterized protein LOC111394347 [Olea europaea var. sylvestris]